MPSTIANSPRFKFFDANGNPAVDYLLNTYAAGSLTPKATWKNQDQSTANTNPVVLDANGECLLWLSDDQEYKFVLTTPGGTVVSTTDNISGGYARLLKSLSAPTGASLIGIPNGRTQADKNAESVSVKDYGAVGNNIVDDTAAFAEAINFVLSQDRPPSLYVPPGIYKITSPLPDLTTGLMIRGDGPRASIITCAGSSSVINVRGTGKRSTDVTLANLGINAAAMTAGYAVTVDFAQEVLLDNVLIADALNGIYARQVGNFALRDVVIDRVRGTAGLLAYGTSTARNGENDQIDIIAFSNVVIQGTYVPGGAIPTAEMLVLDGRVHTVQVNGLRLLSGLRGIVTKNTPAVAANLVPRFITGDALEIESMYAECADFQACTDFWIDNLFAAGSVSSHGVKLGAAVSNWNVNKGYIGSNWMHGVLVDSATHITITDAVISNNSQSVSGYSAVYLVGSGLVQLRGGLLGKTTYAPAYTENQKFGLDTGSFGGVLVASDVDFRGNSIGAVYDNGVLNVLSHVSGCPGYNPRGPALQAVGASPYSYTAGLTQEVVNLYDGTSVVSTIEATVVANQSPCSFVLHPRQTVSISYTTAPKMAINKG